MADLGKSSTDRASLNKLHSEGSLPSKQAMAREKGGTVPSPTRSHGSSRGLCPLRVLASSLLIPFVNSELLWPLPSAPQPKLHRFPEHLLSSL